MRAHQIKRFAETIPVGTRPNPYKLDIWVGTERQARKLQGGESLVSYLNVDIVRLHGTGRRLLMPAHQGKFVAYFRVSTDKQGKSGLGLEAQRQSVMDYLNGGRWSLVADFTEIESGKRNDRVELEKALAACKKQKAKLVIAKLDRLSRNLAFIATLMDSGVEFVAVDNPHANKLTVHILAAVAQHEREIISARTSAALKAAKARGRRLGNPELSEARQRATVAKKESADRYAGNVLPVIRDIQRSGIKSLRGVAKALAARGIPTARGGTWTPVQVSAILRRTL